MSGGPKKESTNKPKSKKPQDAKSVLYDLRKIILDHVTSGNLGAVHDEKNLRSNLAVLLRDDQRTGKVFEEVMVDGYLPTGRQLEAKNNADLVVTNVKGDVALIVELKVKKNSTKLVPEWQQQLLTYLTSAHFNGWVPTINPRSKQPLYQYRERAPKGLGGLLLFVDLILPVQILDCTTFVRPANIPIAKKPLDVSRDFVRSK
jgi:hypothetical protein